MIEDDVLWEIFEAEQQSGATLISAYPRIALRMTQSADEENWGPFLGFKRLYTTSNVEARLDQLRSAQGN